MLLKNYFVVFFFSAVSAFSPNKYIITRPNKTKIVEALKRIGIMLSNIKEQMMVAVSPPIISAAR